MSTCATLAIFFVAVLGSVAGLAHGAVAADQVNFSLDHGQAVAAGNYVIQFGGVNAGAPAYNVYRAGGGLLAQFPSGLPSPNRVYVYDNISIETRSVTSDGLRATGCVWVR